MVNKLRKDLSTTGKPLSMKEFALPFTLNQQITLYADLVNVGGKIVSAEERMDEVIQRYGNPNGGYYNPVVADLTKKIRPRILVVTKTIENLME